MLLVFFASEFFQMLFIARDMQAFGMLKTWTKWFHNVEKCTSFACIHYEKRMRKNVPNHVFNLRRWIFSSLSISQTKMRKWSKRRNIKRRAQKCSVCVIFSYDWSATIHWALSIISDTYNVNVARYQSHVFAVMFVTCLLANVFLLLFLCAHTKEN